MSSHDNACGARTAPKSRSTLLGILSILLSPQAFFGCGDNVDDCPGGSLTTYTDERCGAVEPGTCRETPEPTSCHPSAVCGCDGKTYANRCDAAAHKQDVAIQGTCTAPAGTYACGSMYCATGTEYCGHLTPFPNQSDIYSYCLDVPTTCAKSGACDCIMKDQGEWASACKESATGQYFVELNQ